MNNIYLMEKLIGKYLFMVFAEIFMNSLEENDCLHELVQNNGCHHIYCLI